MNSDKSVSLIADLDLMTNESIGFKFNGKVHRLNMRMSVEDLTNMELARIKLVYMLEERDQIALPGEEIYQRYFEFIHPIVPSLTQEEIRFMNPAQLNSVVNLVFRQLAGDPALFGEKKNPLNRMVPIRGT